jgi:ABC-type Zn2+ transport system substrate-binding protein/surface adhesin
MNESHIHTSGEPPTGTTYIATVQKHRWTIPMRTKGLATTITTNLQHQQAANNKQPANKNKTTTSPMANVE